MMPQTMPRLTNSFPPNSATPKSIASQMT
ncbi:hypothetical protein CPAR01_13568 [Colletotrichum paranaense]|uniref:Uncharacterized protein n=1 Tax=Colletotrichum paranaense TaxID=1914294 RepID=A0ABQ9S3Q5_9PEZI|nr:hypothetical protein CPAR01_13568 [Colletotrichum paranaense]